MKQMFVMIITKSTDFAMFRVVGEPVKRKRSCGQGNKEIDDRGSDDLCDMMRKAS